MKFKHSHICLLICILSAIACNPTKWLAEDEYLLVKNKIQNDLKKGHPDFIGNGLKINKGELASFIKQKPNRKILGIARFHLGVYNYASRKKQRYPKDSLQTGSSFSKKRGRKEKRIEDKLKKIVGEPPVILDTSLTKKSVRQIKLYLNSKGYFNSSVRDSIAYRRKPSRLPAGKTASRGGKAKVYYLIDPGFSRYSIRNITYSIKDTNIYSIVLSEEYASSNSLLQPGNYYDEETLNEERERITKILKNEGYYYFTKGYISYIVDSALGTQQVDITLSIKNLKTQVSSDSLITIDHNRYRINNVYVETNYSSKQPNTSTDTMLFNDYYFTGISPGRFKNQTITRKIFIRKGDFFQINKLENTYKHLAGLQVFKFINIKLNDVPNTRNEHLLDCIIQLTPTPKQSFSIETEGTHSSGNLGVAGNIIYRNKNVFKGAEIFELRLKGAFEAQKTYLTPEDKPGEPLLNTVEIGAEAKLYIPKFFLPVRAEKIPKRFDPKTTLTMAYNYQTRTDYTRSIAKISFGYDWKETNYKTHIFNPVEINLVKMIKVSDNISQNPNPFISNSFTDHFTTALRYTFIFNNQQIKKNINFTYFKTNLELAGNLLNGLNTLAKVEPSLDDGSYQLFKIRYAQYVRSDVDLRYYHVLNQHSTLVYRAAIGIGIPYGNSNVLPFEKSFFSGGANGIRAWKALELGPGSFSSDSITIQLADIKLEGNLEYRFDITKMFQGAAFIDAGNIWMINEDTLRPGAKFQTNRFVSEIAIGAGLGLRLNFTFFIVRLDAAIPLKDPSSKPGNRWFTEFPINFKESVIYNLGIGYPF